MKIYRFTESNFNSSTSKDVIIDVSSVPNYKELTVDNFYIEECTVNPRGTSSTGTITRRYYPSSGELIVGLNVGTSVLSMAGSVKVVCVTM